jgi:hypothetical protein
LIDHVARQMTATQTRSAIRAQVMVTIRAAHQQPAPGWLLPVTASAAVAAVALTWFMLSAPPVIEVVPVARHTPAVATAGDTAPGQPTAPSGVASAAVAPTRARQTVAVEAVAFSASADEIPAAIPTLPPLAGPRPIVIEPIVWDEVTIAPIVVNLIEVRALSIEPLAPAADSGV